MSVLCPSVSCAPPYSEVHTCEGHVLWSSWLLCCLTA